MAVYLAPQITLTTTNNITYINLIDENGTTVVSQVLDTKTGYSAKTVDANDGTGSYKDATGITWTQTIDSSTNTTTTTNDSNDYERIEIDVVEDGSANERITSSTGENYVEYSDVRISGDMQIGAAIYNVDFSLVVTDGVVSATNSSWAATTKYVASIANPAEEGSYISVRFIDTVENDPESNNQTELDLHNGVEVGTYSRDTSDGTMTFNATFEDALGDSGFSVPGTDVVYKMNPNTDGTLKMEINDKSDLVGDLNEQAIPVASINAKLYKAHNPEAGNNEAAYLALIKDDTQTTEGTTTGKWFYIEYNNARTGTSALENGGETGTYTLNDVTGETILKGLTITAQFDDSIGQTDQSGLADEFNAGGSTKYNLITQNHSVLLSTESYYAEDGSESGAFIFNEVEMGTSEIAGIYGSGSAVQTHYAIFFKTPDGSNTAPTISKTIADQVYTVGDTPIDPNDYFTDADSGDVLDYYLRYSDGVVDAFNYSAIDSEDPRDTEAVTIIAMDKAGNTVEQHFNLTIIPPAEATIEVVVAFNAGELDWADVSVSGVDDLVLKDFIDIAQNARNIYLNDNDPSDNTSQPSVDLGNGFSNITVFNNTYTTSKIKVVSEDGSSVQTDDYDKFVMTFNADYTPTVSGTTANKQITLAFNAGYLDIADVSTSGVDDLLLSDFIDIAQNALDFYLNDNIVGDNTSQPSVDAGNGFSNITVFNNTYTTSKIKVVSDDGNSVQTDDYDKFVMTFNADYSTTPIPNTAPVVGNDTATVAEDTTIDSIKVLVNDKDDHNDPITIKSVSSDDGTVTVNTDNTLKFVPKDNFNGDAIIKYVATDGKLDSNEATVTVTVTPVNDAPVAVGKIQDFEVPTQTPNLVLPFDINNYFSDPDGDTLSFYVYHFGRRDGHDGPGHVEDVNNTNSLEPLSEFLSDGSKGGEAGTHPFEIVAVDSSGARSTQSVNIIIPNTPPETVGEMSDVTVKWVEGNPILDPSTYFKDADGDTLTYTVKSERLDGSGSVTDTLAVWNGFNGKIFDVGHDGEWVVTVYATDGKPGTTPASQEFKMTVKPAATNTAPVAVNDTATVDEDTTIDSIKVLDNDSDADSLVIALPEWHNFELNIASKIESDEAERSVDIGGVTWTAKDTWTYSGDVKTSNTFNVSSTDGYSFKNVDRLDVEGLDNHQTETGSRGNFTHKHFNAVDGITTLTFVGTWKLVDGQTLTNMNVSVQVNGYKVTQSASGTFELNGKVINATPEIFNAWLSGSSATTGDVLSVDSASSDDGDVTINTDNTLKFVPNDNFNGDAIIKYIATDGKLDSNEATVTVTVNAVNDAPVAVGEMLDITMTDGDKQSDYQIDPTNYFSDVDGDTLTYTVKTTLNGGDANTERLDQWNNSTWIIGQDGSEAGEMLFVITANDGKGGTETQSFKATINAAPDTNTAPVAFDDTAIVDEDTTIDSIKVLDNDKDTQNDNLTIKSFSSNDGTVTINTDNSLKFVPNDNFNGDAIIKYTATDGKLDSNEATVTVTVNPVNDAPVAVGKIQDFEVPVETKNITLPFEPKDYFSDPDGDTLSFYLYHNGRGSGQPFPNEKEDINNTASLETLSSFLIDGSFGIPGGKYPFQMVAVDSSGARSTQPFNLTIPNTPPETVGEMPNVTTEWADGNLFIDPANFFKDADNDTLTYTVTSKHNADANDVWTESLADWNSASGKPFGDDLDAEAGDLTVTVNAYDNKGPADTVTIVDNIKKGTGNDSINFSWDGLIKVKHNDVEIAIEAMDTIEAKFGKTVFDRESLTDVADSEITDGIIVIQKSYSDNFDPTFGNISVGYVTHDFEDTGDGILNGKYSLFLNTNPDALADTDIAIHEFGHAMGFFSHFDGFGDGPAISNDFWNALWNSHNNESGAVLDDATIEEKFTPDKWGETGAKGTPATQTFTWTVNPEVVNTAPVAVDDTATVDEDTTIDSIKVLDNDKDTQNDNLTIKTAALVDTTQGTVTVNTDNSLKFVPNDNFNGDAIIKYIATDGKLNSNEATVTVTVNPVNDAPTGSVTITGTVQSGQVLTADNDLKDDDGMGTVTYTWSDGTNNLGTGDTYTLTDAEVDKTISVTASYTDGGTEAESKESAPTNKVTAKPTQPELPASDPVFMFTAEAITEAQSSIERFGNDLTGGSNKAFIKLTLNVDMARVTDTNITSLMGSDINLNIDWSQFEDITTGVGIIPGLTAGKSMSAELMSKVGEAGLFTVSEVSNGFEILTLSTNFITTDPSYSSLVDNVDTSMAPSIDAPYSMDIGVIYLNPIDSVKEFKISYSGDYSPNRGDLDNVVQISTTLEVSTSLINATISVDDTHYLDSTSIEFWKDGSDTGSSLAIENTGIKFVEKVEFDYIKLSNDNAFNLDTSLNDIVKLVRHVVSLEELQGNQLHAADINNDNKIDLTDIVKLVRDVVSLETIDTFDLIDKDNNLITSIDPATAGVNEQWTIIANGDVDSSGSFNDLYTTQIDII